MIAASEACRSWRHTSTPLMSGQPEVKQHDIAGRAAQRIGAHGYAVGGVPGPLEPADQLCGDARVVFHDEH